MTDMDDGSMWTIIIAVVAVLVIVGLCIYYMSGSRDNK